MQMITFEGLDGEVFVGVAKSNRPITLTYTDSIGKAHTIK